MWWDFVDKRIVGAPAKFSLVNCEYVKVMPVLEWILISGLSALDRGGGFLTMWKGWDPSSRLLITRSTQAGSDPVLIANWFASHLARGIEANG